MNPPPFLIMALPRSRTFWLSRFLSFGGWECGHDQLRFMRGVEDVKAWLGTPCFGSVETTAAPFWRLAKRWRPDLRLATVRRSPEAVMDSLTEIRGVVFQPDLLLCNLRRLDAKLDQVEARTGALRVDFAELDDPQVCKKLWQHCLGSDVAWVEEWWQAADAANVQIDFPALVRYSQANAPALASFAAIARQQSLALLRQRPLRAWGVSCEAEPFEDFYADAGDLLAQHTISVGEPAGAHLRRNVGLLRRLETQGALLTTTGRSAEGKLLGYLLHIISPSLEDPAKREALATAFFCQSEVSGLGLRLQRTALQALRRMGVDKAIWRAGLRAEGPRLGLLAQRLGASPLGTLWHLDLKEKD